MTYVLGVDVGGSKIDAQLFAVQDNTLGPDPVWRSTQDTARGRQPHAKQVAGLIEQAAAIAAQRDGRLQAAAIASPGRFDGRGVIKAGTNSNLGFTASEFDGVALKSLYLTELGRVMPLYVANDADAMLAGMLDSLLASEKAPQLYGRQVALLGIGTGLGHAIARIDGSGTIAFVTDGHASKLRLPVDAEDRLALASVQPQVDVVLCDDGTVRAEDLMRGPVIAALSGVKDSREIDMGVSRHAAVLCFAGSYMARLIALIASGQSQDIVPANGWSAQDKKDAAQTQIYLIGGGVGSSALGERMILYAQAELERHRLSHIELWHVAREGNTARAAALLALRR